MAFFGDLHGDFRPVKAALVGEPPAHSFFLGDFDLNRPMEVELADLIKAGSEVRFIHGNHDADRESWHDFVFESGLAHGNLSGQVAEFSGLKIAGLGGVFHEAIWHPKDGSCSPKFDTRSDYLGAMTSPRWRDGLPLRHRSTIFPEDFNALASFEADILISHEAPSSHRYGHADIDDLAEMLGVKVTVHGHLHQDYKAVLQNGIKVIGLGKASLLLTSFDELVGR